ncbi:MAG: SpoIID/LytB domain-containing protein [Clostridium sp.]|nr:SpoIID/LytB domain-containing protein [Clostridium sp.]
MDSGHFRLNKSQRMQLKRFICILGLLLLLLLFGGRILVAFLNRDSKENPPGEEHIPVIQLFTNVWIMEVKDASLLIFRDGQSEEYAFDGSVTPDALWREQLGDVEITDGFVTKVTVKAEKINGKVLSADASGVELEGYGKLLFTADCKGYRIYNTLESLAWSDLIIGYSFTDFVVENGAVCGFLQAREDAMEMIRVLIKSTDYESLFHETATVTADTDFTISYGDYADLQTVRYAAGEEVVIDSGSEYFSGGRITVTPDVLTGRVSLKEVKRSQGIPFYRGHIELEKTESGIVAVNELSLEEYLYSVVPSEMPASYPAQALRAQAVCARTYAYIHMQRAGYPQYGAHVDDSTSYQVYNNILEQESTTTAVKNSHGQMLYREDGILAETYYYSTSCGMGTDATIWKTQTAPTLTYLKAKAISSKTLEESRGAEDIGEKLKSEDEFEAFIKGKDASDFEVSEGWYRWSYQVKKLDSEHMSEVLSKRYEANENRVLTLENGEYVSKPVKAFSEVNDIYVEKRGAGGVCDELVIETDSGTYKVISEHVIRYVLNDGESRIMRQDGTAVDCPTILPSGFFMIDTVKSKKKVTGYVLTGGGFGHGVGMSQNGARDMAEYGMTAEEILTFFFDGCTLKNIYET